MEVRPVGAEFHADGQTCEADSRFFAILRTLLKINVRYLLRCIFVPPREHGFH